MKYNNIKKYVFESILLYVVYMAILIFIFVEFGILMALIASIVFLIPLRLCVILVVRNTIESILTKELNASKFKDIISSYKWLNPPLFYLILAEYYNGNYSNAIYLIDFALKKSTSKALKSTFISLKARIYFEVDDIVRLKNICNYVEMHKNEFEKLWVFQFYQDYANKNYSLCYEFCNKIKSDLNKKSFRYKLSYVNNLFDYAVVYFKLGDLRMAKEYFSNIINFAPQLHISNVSHKYLRAIDENSEIEINICDCNTKCKIPHKNSKKNVVLMISFVVCLLLLFIPDIINISKDHEYKQEIREFEKKLNSAIQVWYDEYSIVNYFNLSRNGEITDTFCIVEDTDGEYDIGCIVSDNNSQTFDYVLAVDNIDMNTSYYVRSFTGNHEIQIDIGLENAIDAKTYDKMINIETDNLKVKIGFLYFY